MHMIELKKDGLTFAVNADFITCVIPGKTKCGQECCKVFTSGNSEPYLCNNSYDEVMRMLPESTVPALVRILSHSPWGDDDADDILASDPEEGA